MQHNFEAPQLEYELTLISSAYDRALFSGDVTAWILVVTMQHHEKHSFVLNLHDKQYTHLHYSHTFVCYIIIFFLAEYVSNVLYKICRHMYMYVCIYI
jgi:hypothetical protein